MQHPKEGIIMAEWWASISKTFYKCFIRENRYQLLVNGIKNTIRISLAAACIGIIIGFLKAKAGANEFLVSMMSTYVVIYLLQYSLGSWLQEDKHEYLKTNSLKSDSIHAGRYLLIPIYVTAN